MKHRSLENKPDNGLSGREARLKMIVNKKKRAMHMHHP
jgi:hypothetical protein